MHFALERTPEVSVTQTKTNKTSVYLTDLGIFQNSPCYYEPENHKWLNLVNLYKLNLYKNEDICSDLLYSSSTLSRYYTGSYSLQEEANPLFFPLVHKVLQDVISDFQWKRFSAFCFLCCCDQMEAPPSFPESL